MKKHMKKYLSGFLRPLLVMPLLLLLSSNLFAVGLGEITVQSALNEPFKARIALVKTGDLNEAQLRAVLASAQEFEKHHMSRDTLYTDLRFDVDLQNAAGPSILLTTKTPVKEPSLDFLVELSWPTGKIVRGYTVLLERP